MPKNRKGSASTATATASATADSTPVFASGKIHLGLQSDNGSVAPSIDSGTPKKVTVARPPLTASPSTSPLTTPLSERSTSFGRSMTHSPINTPQTRAGRVRSRTSTSSYTPPLAPVMSRENSAEDLNSPSQPSLQLPTFDAQTISTGLGRKTSRSSSNASSRPPLSVSVNSSHRSERVQRAQSYNTPSSSAGPSTAPMASLLSSSHESTNPRAGLKRRISTPSIAHRLLEDEEEEPSARELKVSIAQDAKSHDEKRKARSETRGRSTSTSIVVPEDLIHRDRTGSVSRTNGQSQPIPANTWAPIFVTPATPIDTPSHPIPLPAYQPTRRTRGIKLLNSVYNAGESSIMRLGRFIRPKQRQPMQRRGSDDDSEKGLGDSEEDVSAIDTSTINTRTSEDSLRRNGRYWGIWGASETEGEAEDESGYFSLPPTPPMDSSDASLKEFQAALNSSTASLPTPALSTKSLSRSGSKRDRRALGDREGTENDGWLGVVYSVWSGVGSRSSGGKTAEVMRDLGWTVALLVGLFLVTGTLALWMIQAMPITQLKHLPKSTTDLQLLSAEIRNYMTTSNVGWWHTIGVLTFVGCWKHAWSVPGAVVLNILVGSVLEPMPALLLLTIITASGSLCSYLLSRPLAPLIAVLFPKPLALVRAALAPDQPPIAPIGGFEMANGHSVTAVHVGPNAAAPAIGSGSKGSVWRRLLVMRAMGFVPWSGMNVACGVVNVDWKIFWLTTAAGSASWSYVTASVGNILSRLAIPPAALENGSNADIVDGESLTSLLRDPVLIAKLVFLSGLTLLPVVLKKRRGPINDEPDDVRGYSSEEDEISSIGHDMLGTNLGPISPPISPTSPLTRSLARFTPTPAAFDLLSFGRTALRQSGRMVVGTLRSVGMSARRVVG